MDFPLRLTTSGTGTLHLSVEPVADAHRRRWRVRLIVGDAGFHGTAALVAALPGRSTAAEPTTPWFLLPGFFYGQGRTDGSLRYPALGPAGDDPWQHPAWDFALDRMASPISLARSEGRWRGIDWSPHYSLAGAVADPKSWGDSEPQVGVGLSWQHGHGSLRLNLPANESPRRHARNPHDGATVKRLRLTAQSVIELTVGWWDVEASEAAEYAVIEQIRRELATEHPRAELGDPAELADTAAHGIRAWHWIPAASDGRPGYFVYTAAMDRSVEFNANVNRGTSLGWHFEALGFVGGFPVAFGLLWHGLRRAAAEPEQAAASRAIAEAVIDRWCSDGVAPCGLFRTSYHPGRARTLHGEYANGSDTPGYGSCWQGDSSVAHARTTADASYYLARILTLCGPDHPRHGAHRRVLRGTLEAALRLQLANGRHPQIYDVVAGTVRRADGAGGLLWIPAMHRALPLFTDDPGFQDRLRASMRHAGDAYAADVEAGYVVGAPEDVSLAPTSEDGYNAVMAYAALHDLDGDARWLRLWRLAADWTLTWRKAYNVRFDRRNVLGAGGLRTVGGDFASSNNNHLHVYGCNCIGDLIRLSEITGEPHYCERALDHVAFTSQLLCAVDGQWNGQRGMLTEQFYTTDWSIWGAWDPSQHHVQKGTYMGFSHVWCINMVLLALEELERAEFRVGSSRDS
ncbi:hypothetical protein LBMAG53_29320 [Planctomycetota bacterium]|nr:hypothetical protein LBMAG53_29320 [Planctomycetota bacterium]